METTITETHSASAGDASHIDVRALSDSEFITACRSGSGRLLLIGWLIEPKGNGITRAGDNSREKVGEVDEIAMVILDRTVVTAVRDGSGKLLLISWSAPPGTGPIRRLKDSHGDKKPAGKASAIAITALTASVVVTACAAGNGDLLLIAWKIDESGSITRLEGEARAGRVSAVSITTLGTAFPSTVLTAVRNGSGNLECIAWDVAQDGSSIVRVDVRPGEAGAISEVAVVAQGFPSDGFPPRGFITAVVNASRNLQVIAWTFGDGDIERRGSVEAGTASHISLSDSGPTDIYVACMRRGSGDEQLIAYRVDVDGVVERTGDFSANEAGDNDIKGTSITGSGRAITAMRRRDHLSVKAWDVTNSEGF